MEATRRAIISRDYLTLMTVQISFPTIPQSDITGCRLPVGKKLDLPSGRTAVVCQEFPLQCAAQGRRGDRLAE
jgi:hypothetical protein